MRQALDHYQRLVALMVDTQRVDRDDDWDALLGFEPGDREALATIAANAAIEAGVAPDEVLGADDYFNACEAFIGAVTAIAVQRMAGIYDLGALQPSAILPRVSRTHVAIPEHHRGTEFSFVIVPSGFLVAVRTYLRLHAKLGGQSDFTIDPFTRFAAETEAIERAFAEREQRSFQWVIGACRGLSFDRLGGACDLPMSLSYHATMADKGLQVWEELAMGAGIGGAKGLPELDAGGFSAARAILAYATLHELAHALLLRSGAPRVAPADEEVLCDEHAILMAMLVSGPLARFHLAPDFQVWALNGFFPVMLMIKLAHVFAAWSGDGGQPLIHLRQYNVLRDRAIAAATYAAEKLDASDDESLGAYFRAHLASVHALTDGAYDVFARRLMKAQGITVPDTPQ